MERKILSSGVAIRDSWAVELDEMDSTMTPRDGMEIRAHVKMVIVHARQADGKWRVARLMELLNEVVPNEHLVSGLPVIPQQCEAVSNPAANEFSSYVG